MFSISNSPTFTHTVKINVPVNGGYEQQSFQATFNVLPTEEAARFDLSNGEETTAFLKRIIAHLDDLAGPDGKPVPYNSDLRDRLIQLPYVRIPVAAAYFDGVTGSYTGN